MIITTWLWGDSYSAEIALRALNAIQQYYQCRTVVFSDKSLFIPGTEVIVVDISKYEKLTQFSTSGLGKRYDAGCIRRTLMFNTELMQQFGEEMIVNIDLDLEVKADPTSIFENIENASDKFSILRGTNADGKFNGSIFGFKNGAFNQLWDDLTVEEFTKALKTQVGTEQAWFRYKLEDTQVNLLGAQHGIYQARLLMVPQATAASNVKLLFFAGLIKPWDKSNPQYASEFKCLTAKCIDSTPNVKIVSGE